MAPRQCLIVLQALTGVVGGNAGPFLSLWLPGGAQALGEGGRRGKIEVEDESKNADQLEGSGWAHGRLSIG